MLIDNYQTFVLATPVYWYAMSGVMKVFFDRMTDLLDNDKELGRQLRNKKMAVITSSNGNNLENNFWLLFIASSNYLGIKYVANLHTINNQINTTALLNFIQSINNS